MTPPYEADLSHLRRLLLVASPDEAMVGEALQRLRAHGRRETPYDLLMLIAARPPLPEASLLLMRVAETYDDAAYVRALLAAFPALVKATPQWSSTLLMRVLNHPPSSKEMRDQILRSSDEIKDAIYDKCLSFVAASDEFLAIILPIKLAIEISREFPLPPKPAG